MSSTPMCLKSTSLLSCQSRGHTETPEGQTASSLFAMVKCCKIHFMKINLLYKESRIFGCLFGLVKRQVALFERTLTLEFEYEVLNAV